MTRKLLCSVVLSLILGLGVAVGEEDEGPTPEDRAKIAEKLQPSLAGVEIWLKHDKGEQPPHSDTIAEKRPFEVAGYVLAPEKVFCQDMAFHPRFVKEINVCYGDRVVAAEPWAYMLEQNGMILKLAEPLEEAKPLEFQADAEGPYLLTPYYKHSGVWTLSVESASGDAVVNERGEQYTPIRPYSLVTDSEGTPVAMCFNKRLPLDGSWKGSPLDQPLISATEYQRKLSVLEEKCAGSILHVTLNFRSPKKGRQRGVGNRSDQGEAVTEMHLLGGVVDANTLLIAANLKPSVTARLERIKVHLPGGDTMPAAFQCTLADYGALLASTEEALPGEMEACEDDVLDQYMKLLLAADIRIQGEKRVAYFHHGRIGSYSLGYERRIYPDLNRYGNPVIYFDTEGRLVVMPLERRRKGSSDRYWRGEGMLAMPAKHLREILDDLENRTDPSNVPVSEEEENRLAWMGVVLQRMTPELARANNVSDRTRNGSTGGIVSYVYPDSPAAEAGVEPGWILLRLHVEGEPEPFDVQVERSPFGGQPFPWDQLDQVPEQYFEHLPQPWPSARNDLTRALTEFGFGEQYTADFFSDGEVVPRKLEIVQSPPHYDSAPRYKSEELGMTVRNMTFEIRRYFQKTPEEEGVIISKVEPGSKASVGGIKPYEIVTDVNGEPVTNVEEFEERIAGKEELRIGILRMTRARQVKIKLEAKEDEAPEEDAGEAEEGEKSPEATKDEQPEPGAEPAESDSPEEGAGE